MWQDILKIRLKYNTRARIQLMDELTNEWQTAKDLHYSLTRKYKVVPNHVQIGKFLKFQPNVEWEERRGGRVYRKRD